MLFVILFTGNLKRDELCIKKNEYKWTIVCIVFVPVIGLAKNNLRKCRTDQIPIIKKKKEQTSCSNIIWQHSCIDGHRRLEFMFGF